MDVKRFDVAAAKASELIKALAHPARLRIVCALAGQESSVTSLSQTVGIPISTVSRHLMLLRKDRIVKARRFHQSMFYSLGDESIMKLVAVLAETFCSDMPPKRLKGQSS
jgi:ArsR family transcriptional regulator, virulence genes transcriptional regulator